MEKTKGYPVEDIYLQKLLHILQMHTYPLLEQYDLEKRAIGIEENLKRAISGNRRVDSKAKLFDSILKKSIHFEDDRFRDSLI